MSSMDDKIRRSKEQQHAEGHGEKRKSGYSSSSSGSSSQIDRINAELAKPNLSDSARKALQEKKRKLGG
ncbi:MAG: hypothetical protein J7641_22820 [Cyanobacteria bacterium SID2]|nr:hypothetical protein [Cyanobacteria bacterium SID2]MBP0003989.1 hypothetical protein [Cyanobacteria bacterium SBC]